MTKRMKQLNIRKEIKAVLSELNKMTGIGFRFLDEVFREAGIGKDLESIVLLYLEQCELVEVNELEEEKIIRITRFGREIANSYKK